MKKYPKEVFILRENDSQDDEFLGVWDSLESLATVGESKKVALYELKRVIRVNAKVVIEESISKNG